MGTLGLLYFLAQSSQSGPSGWELVGAAGGLLATIKMVSDWLGSRVKPSVFVEFGRLQHATGRIVIVVCNVGVRPFAVRRIEPVRIRGRIVGSRLLGRVEETNTVFDVVSQNQDREALSPGQLKPEFIDWMETVIGKTHIKIVLNPSREIYVPLPTDVKEARRWFLFVRDLLGARVGPDFNVIVSGSQVHVEGRRYRIGLSPLEARFRRDDMVGLATGPAVPQSPGDDSEAALLPQVLADAMPELVELSRNANGSPSFRWTERARAWSRGEAPLPVVEPIKQ